MDQAAAIAEIRERELSLHRAETRRSQERVAAVLADDFLEFGRSGRAYDKAMIVQLLAAEADAALPPVVEDFAVRFLSPTVALATYRSNAPKRHALRSSIWRREDGAWRMTFHQGTPIPPT